MLRLDRSILDAIDAHGVKSYPYEGCGLLLGAVENGANVVSSLFPVANSWGVEEEKRERFHINPEDMLAAELAAAAEGLDVIGIFHSHPDHPPIASARDLAWASWPGYSYLITEVRSREPGRSRSWQLRADRSGFDEEPVEVEGAGGK